MKQLEQEGGFGFLEIMVALVIVALASMIFLSSFTNYQKSQRAIEMRSLSRESRHALLSQIVQATQLYASKGCDRRTTSVAMGSGGYRQKYLPIRTQTIATFGISKFNQFSFNDLIINSPMAGSAGLARPAKFDFPSSRRDLFNDAVKRCNSYSLSPTNDDTSFNGCYELASNIATANSGGVTNRLKAEKNLVEFRLEFINLVNDEAIACGDLAGTAEAGITLKMLTFWGGDDGEVFKIFDVFAFAG